MGIRHGSFLHIFIVTNYIAQISEPTTSPYEYAQLQTHTVRLHMYSHTIASDPNPTSSSPKSLIAFAFSIQGFQTTESRNHQIMNIIIGLDSEHRLSESTLGNAKSLPVLGKLDFLRQTVFPPATLVITWSFTASI